MAGRPCRICHHARRDEIEAAIFGGAPFRTVAQRYGMKHPSVLRHRNQHMAEQLAAAAEARRAGGDGAAPSPPATSPLTASSAPTSSGGRRQDTAEALDVLGQLRAINSAALVVLRDARTAGDGRLVLLAIDRIHRQLELQAKLLGELDDRPTINLLMAPEWILVRSTVLSALQPYPDATVAVSAALVALESA